MYYFMFHAQKTGKKDQQRNGCIDLTYFYYFGDLKDSMTPL